MKHIRIYEDFGSVNESENYNTLGTYYPFKDVVKFLRDYQDAGSIAVLGYNDEEENFHGIPLKDAKYDEKKDYVAALMTVDKASVKKIMDDKKQTMKNKLKSIGKDLDSVIDEIWKTKGEKSLHSFVHLDFDEDGRLYGAERYGANDVGWLVDSFEMASEHSDEYNDFMSSEDDDENFEDDEN